MPPALRCPQCDAPAASDGPTRYECPRCRHRWSPTVGEKRLREAADALDLAIEFRDVDVAGGIDVLARRLEEAGRIRRAEPEVGSIRRVGNDAFRFTGCARGGMSKGCRCDGGCWVKEGEPR